MVKLIMLGTGSTYAMDIYNTCFALQMDDEYMLVDAGGGNSIIKRLSEARIPVSQIHHIYLSDDQTEHILGMVWVIRILASAIRDEMYEGDLRVYCHGDLVETLRSICTMTLPRKLTWLFDHRIIFVPVYDGDTRKILGHQTTFFDLRSPKTKQYGFTMEINEGERFTFAGDSPLSEECFDYAYQSTWLMHEAYCLFSQQEQFRPYEYYLNTVKDACELAQYMEVPNLILTNTEEFNIKRRRDLYVAEGRLYYKGNILVPDDLEVIELSSGTGQMDDFPDPEQLLGRLNFASRGLDILSGAGFDVPEDVDVDDL